MRTRHTCGPWLIDPYNTGTDIVIFGPSADNRDNIVNVGVESDGGVRKLADAHLIASAPDLLEACEKVFGEFNDLLPGDILSLLFKAIKKANGES